jgi:hypothetical protein
MPTVGGFGQADGVIRLCYLIRGFLRVLAPPDRANPVERPAVSGKVRRYSPIAHRCSYADFEGNTGRILYNDAG